jgi:Tfp pilus assembly protein PilF
MSGNKYRAFISYSHADTEWADWLHRSLEQYRVPRPLVGTEGRDGPIPQRLFPIYRDRAETPATADLQEYVTKALQDSDSLIVICSPNARRSRWVDQEIITFKRLGRENRIFAVIVGGEPNVSELQGEESPYECFPRALRVRLRPDGTLSSEKIEPAAADARPQKDGREGARLKLIAGILGLDLDVLRRRDVEQERRRARLFGGIAIFMGVLAVAAAIGGVLAYHYAWLSQKANAAAQVQASVARQTKDFMVGLFSNADPEQNQGATITAKQLLDKGSASILSQLGEADEVKSNLMRAMGQAYSGLGLYPRANALLKLSLEAALRSGNADDVVGSRVALADNDYQRAAYRDAIAGLKLALKDESAREAPDKGILAKIHYVLADSLDELDQAHAAEENYREALALSVAATGEKSDLTADIENGFGTFLYDQGRFVEAKAHMERALAIQRSLHGNQSAGIALVLGQLGALAYQTGDYSAAENLYEQALQAKRAVYGPYHLQIGIQLNNVARLQLMRNDLRDAQRNFNDAITIDRKHLQKDDARLVWPLNSLGMIALANSDMAAASTYLLEALRIAELQKTPQLDQVLGNCAELYARQNRIADALAAMARARSEQAAQYGDKLKGAEAWRAAVLDLSQAKIDQAVGNHQSANVLVVNALPRLRARFGRDGFYTQAALAVLVKINEELGHRTAAWHFRSMLTHP